MVKESLEYNKKEHEIDLIQIIKLIWKFRINIYKSVVISIITGIFFIIGSPKLYKSETKLLIETGTGTSAFTGLLQQFGGFAGINIGNKKGDEALVPELYPDIVKSTPFLLEIIDQRIQTSKSDSFILVSDYLSNLKISLAAKLKKYSIGLPITIFDYIKTRNEQNIAPTSKVDISEPLILSKKTINLLKILDKIILVNQNEDNGTLSISVETQDPKVSAMLCNQIFDLLSQYIIEYRIQKAKSDLYFIEDRYKEAEKRFKLAQNNLAYYKDQNKNLILASAQTNEQNLQSEYNLTFNIYNTLSQQLEQAKMKVQEKTPVFKIIEPAKIPLVKSKPRTLLSLFYLSIFGFVIGSLIIIYKNIKFVKA